MDNRHDSLAATSEFVLVVEDTARSVTDADDSTTVGTVGKLDISPNVIPGRTDLTVDIRSVEEDLIEAVIDDATTTLDEIEAKCGVDTSFDRPWHRDPVQMDTCVRDAFHAAGKSTDIATMDLASGAAHDTMYVVEVTDAAPCLLPQRMATRTIRANGLTGKIVPQRPPYSPKPSTTSPPNNDEPWDTPYLVR